MVQASFLKTYKTPLLLTLVSVAFYMSFAYDLHRADVVKLISLYSALFFIFYKLVQLLHWNFKFLIGIAILFRLVFLLATPNLSQDFYRFIWDGRRILEGFNPYLYTPNALMAMGKDPVAQAQELVEGMGALSASHFSNYPPVKQLVFFIAALISGKSILGSIIVFRIIIIAADLGTLFIGKKLMDHLNIPSHHLMWYILNPFIIIELTGNLHFEGLMLFFLLLSLYLLYLHKWKIAALVFALSISVKLVPLLFLPLLLTYFIPIRKFKKTPHNSNGNKTSFGRGLKKAMGFYAIVGMTTLVLFAPFYSPEFIDNYANTVRLWFSSFEFNASVYYFARYIGYLISGYNQIGIIGKFIPIITVLVVLFLTFLKNNRNIRALMVNMLFAISIYYFISTTVHPWYLATLLLVSVFTNYKFPLVWSFMAILSYVAYSNASTTENLWMIGLEYTVVYAVFFWEVFKMNRGKEVLT